MKKSAVVEDKAGEVYLLSQMSGEVTCQVAQEEYAGEDEEVSIILDFYEKFLTEQENTTCGERTTKFKHFLAKERTYPTYSPLAEFPRPVPRGINIVNVIQQ